MRHTSCSIGKRFELAEFQSTEARRETTHDRTEPNRQHTTEKRKSRGEGGDDDEDGRERRGDEFEVRIRASQPARTRMTGLRWCAECAGPFERPRGVAAAAVATGTALSFAMLSSPGPKLGFIRPSLHFHDSPAKARTEG